MRWKINNIHGDNYLCPLHIKWIFTFCISKYARNETYLQKFSKCMFCGYSIFFWRIDSEINVLLSTRNNRFSAKIRKINDIFLFWKFGRANSHTRSS